MSRCSSNIIDKVSGKVKSGFDYDLQCWIENFIVLNCGHKPDFNCQCNARRYQGQDVRLIK